ncbi:16S rRNA (guanine(527)-N(7))-methyltransferase RsmG [Alteribacillus bidgolensis]|uniref:Ribosomal RNA small subunit methyltransferase G n=1 Tax=Alteribacillus bidgolensis TaxID=930129 RepID=A0A1G8LQL0_9BACI|nr:16S rRNA (guanine(527)-N(7))-methyltransferase RsmG [Alteribacillus bidgolensis]SDI57992.1 16S rRNA m(7)G-527 methyltransferase [Alteribacillus bidgolensis]
MSKHQFGSWLQKEGIQLTEKQEKQFEVYYRMLVDWNQKMNLTGITEEDEVYEKHFYDSLTAVFSHNFHNVNGMVDIGAGAGFPSIPIKICFPHLKVVIVDSLQKRTRFLEQLAGELQLQNVDLLHGRAEELAHNPAHREKYDVAIARAVARMSVLTELCLPFVRRGGTLLAMKGSTGLEEKEEAGKACRTLGGKWLDSYSLQLPNEKSERYILRMEKIDSTPKTYPRKPGTPSKKPLV